MSIPKLLVVIAGPTAVGKTGLGIKLAKHYHTEILSADSRQFFKEMCIGTAKPDSEEMQGVLHHFIDSHSVHEPYNAGQFETDALARLQEIFLRHQVAFLVGGSGLYIKAVCDGLDDLPPGDSLYRALLTKELESQGLDKLQMLLKEKDPDFYVTADIQNPHRVIRALEVIHVSGQPFSSFRTSQPKKRDFNIIKIGIEVDRPTLYARIEHRMDLMISKGLLQEAEQLYPLRALNALQTVGYEEIFGYIEGKYDWEEAVRLLKRNSRRYAKRQMTWFKKDKSYHWFHPDDKTAIVTLIDQMLASDLGA